MLSRRKQPPVLAQIPAARDGSARLGSLGRGTLDAFAALSKTLSGASPVVTSGAASTTVALGLATAAAAEGKRVALLECDLATPVLATTLELASGPGLNEYLNGEAEATQILQSLVLAGPASGRATEPLVCIVAGDPTSSMATLLGSDDFRHAAEKLRRAYDLLVIDGPPLHGDEEALKAVTRMAEVILACGARNEVPRRPAVRLSGLVVQE